jgi:hypothetical protein
MVDMNTSSLATAAAVGLLAALVPAAASAKAIELGATTSPLVSPTCPAGVKPQNCTIVLTQVTALETIRDSVTYPTIVKKAGMIVAFTLGLSQLDNDRTKAKADIHFLDTTFGGTTRAGIAVLKAKGPASQRSWTVTAQSPIFRLQPYLGQVVQFPLATALPVTPGEVVALTVPTWAPVLTFDLPTKQVAYRQSRASNCKTPAATEQAQLLVGGTASYGCNYPGTRVEYTATEITNPAQTKNFVHAPDRKS